MTPALEIRGLSLRFGGFAALQDVDVTVPEGSCVGLIGPNGAGKTTLVNAVSGLLRPDAGAVYLRGKEISRLTASRRAEAGIGRTFQNLGVDPTETVAANLRRAMHLCAPYHALDTVLRPWRRAAGERALDIECDLALRSVGLLDHRNRLVGDLSFATVRFVELAGILARRPSLLLLDEPTTGLDGAEVARLQGLLDEARMRGTAMLVVAHDIGFVMRACDHVYVLAEGSVLFHGPPTEVAQEPAVIEVYLGAPP